MRNPTYRWIKAAMRKEDTVEHPMSRDVLRLMDVVGEEEDIDTLAAAADELDRLRAENAALAAACRLIEDGMVLHADGRFVVTTYAVLAVRAALAQAGGEA